MTPSVADLTRLEELERRARLAANRDASERFTRMQIKPETVLALVRVARAAEEFVAVAEKALWPTPDKPETAWSKMRATAAALQALK